MACGRELEAFEAGKVHDGEDGEEEKSVEEADETEEQGHVEDEGAGANRVAFEGDCVRTVDYGGEEGEAVAEEKFCR